MPEKDVYIFFDGSTALRPRVPAPDHGGRSRYLPAYGDAKLTLFSLAFEPRDVHGVQVWVEQ